MINNIKQFITAQDKCIFCKTELRATLNNAIQIDEFTPTINVIIENDLPVFRLKYDGDRTQVDVFCQINLLTNEVIIKNVNKKYIEQDSLNDIIEIFNNMSPHIRLECHNKKCGSHYFLISTYFILSQSLSIKPIKFYMECFKFNNLLAVNYVNESNTYVYSKPNTQFDPLIISPKIDFKSMPKDKIISKINTWRIFS